MFYPGYYYLQSSALHGLVWSGARGPQAPQTQSKHSHQPGTQPSRFTYTIIHLQSRSCNTGNQHTLPNHTLTDARTKKNTKKNRTFLLSFPHAQTSRVTAFVSLLHVS